jgi:mannitol-specific phosphotransferase system IIBC component
MTIVEGTKYQISDVIKCNFNSADTLTIVRQNGVTAQFTLGDGKGSGAMPINHFNYLLKRAELKQIRSKRTDIDSGDEEKDMIG